MPKLWNILQPCMQKLLSILGDVKETLYDIVKEEVRRLITHDKVSPDGRKLEEIRPIECDIDLLPRTHGSGLFTLDKHKL